MLHKLNRKFPVGDIFCSFLTELLKRLLFSPILRRYSKTIFPIVRDIYFTLSVFLHGKRASQDWIKHIWLRRAPYKVFFCLRYISTIFVLPSMLVCYTAVEVKQWRTISIYLVVYSLHHNVLPTLQSIPLMTNGPLYPITQDSSCHGQHTMPRNPWSFPMTSSA